MRILPQVEMFLRGAIGLRGESVSVGGMTGAVRERMRACGTEDEGRYLDVLKSSKAEQDALIERVVIPETWFFRDDKPFDALRDYVGNTWLARLTPAAPLRLLSIPCATGEEPYSMAITLLELGLTPAQWRIDACDVSREALAKARAGAYSQHSFRCRNLAFRERYFRKSNHRYVLDETVRRSVHFERGNIMDPDFARGRSGYDVIFFRNLMIYLGEEEQSLALASLERLLCPEGLLFIGHSEYSPLLSRWFIPAGYPGAFAFRKRPLESRPLAERPGPQPRARNIPPAALGSPLRRPNPIAEPRTASLARPDRPSPNTPESLLEAARRHADFGQLEEAGQLCGALLQMDRQCAAAFHLLGLIHDAKGETTKAETCFRKVLYIEPDHQEALNHLALSAERGGDVAGALRFRERARRAQQPRPERTS